MDKPAKILIRNGRVIDPASGTDETLDILLAEGRIAAVKTSVEATADKVIDASRLVVIPGLIDMHVHLREPGAENKETIASGSRAAARGGFTTVCGMPNTRPVNDNRKVTARILEEAARSAVVNILPIAAVTTGSKGEELTDMAALAQAGAAAFSDDGSPVASSRLMTLALEKAQSLGRLVIDHCEDKALSRDGVMHAGKASARLGLKGIPAAAEDIMVARDIILARDLAAPVHIAHLSTKGAALAVEAAKARGIRVSAEATPHHLLLSDESVVPGDADFKMNPPLRSREDVDALLAALRSGAIDVIATDHAPHTESEKGRGFEKAPFGIVGLETAVSLVLDRLVHKGVISLPRFVALMSLNPARLLGLGAKGRIAEGADADLTLLNLAKDVVVDKNAFESKSRNTPFHGWKLKGQAVMTIVGGRIVYPFDAGRRPG
jgi:dihydroorotase